tara:strand:- start:12 stop:2315 length:2304 start_codon:yes stop_codon:yes gene_type:complete
MIKSVLLDYVEKAGVLTGNLKAMYDLSGSVDTVLPADRDSNYKLTSGSTNALDTYVVYNKLLPTGSQLVLDEEDNHLISAEGYPAVIASSSTTITGSGLFDGSCSLRLASPELGDSWTCFLDFSGYDIDVDTFGLNQVLVSTMNSENSLSGFNFGVNGSNRLYYEYISGGENTYFDEEGTEKTLNVSPSFQRETESMDNHLKNLNVVSLSKTNNGIEFSLHRPNEITESLKTLTPEYSGANHLFLGGMSPEFINNGELYDSFYTGFSGYVNTFLLFNDYIPEASRNTIAESFWTDSYTPETLETGESTHKEVTGVSVQNVLSGQGVVSYSLDQTGSYVNENGQTVPLYGQVPVMGNVYHDVLVDQTGPNDIKSITGKYVPEKSTKKNSYVNDMDRVAGKIKFAKPLQVGEIYEIYSHDSFLNTLASKAETLGGGLHLRSFGAFEPDGNVGLGSVGVGNVGIDFPPSRRDEKMFARIRSENFTYKPSSLQPYFQLFRNGLYQQEVSGLYTVDAIFYLYDVKKREDITSAYHGDYFIHDPEAGIDGNKFHEKRIKNNEYFIALNSQHDTWNSREDNLVFDLTSGSAITGEYNGEPQEFGGDYYGKDIYYNGQKLISGIHYVHTIDSNGDPAYYTQPPELTHDEDKEASLSIPVGAKFVFVPAASNYYTRQTGIVRPLDNEIEEVDVDNIFFEQVWRNGRRMIPGVDYFKAPSNSLIAGGDTPSQKNDSFVMQTETNSIDVKISSEAENLNNKVFSLDNINQKQNLFEKV